MSSAQPALARLRLALIVLGGAATLLALTGLLAHAIFRQPTALKYIVSVLAPAALVVVAAADRPLRPLTGIVIALAPFGRLETTFSGTAIPLGAVLLGAALLAAVLHSPVRARLSALGFAGVLVVLLLIGPLLGGRDVPYNLIWLAEILTVAWLVGLVASEPGGATVLLGALAVGIAAQAALAVYEFHTGHLINFYGSAGSSAFGQDYFFTFGPENRPIGSFNDPISLGNVLALALPLLLSLTLMVRGWISRFAVVVVVGVAAVALVLTLSRMSWIGAALGVLVTVALLPARHRAASMLVVVAMLAPSAAIAAGHTGSTLGKRAESILHPTASASVTAAGDIERAHIWNAALSIFSEHPIAGVGMDNINPELARRTTGITRFSHAHSTYLQALAEAGVCGGLAILVAWLATSGAIIGGLRRSAALETRLLAAGLAGSALATLVSWSTDYTVHQIAVATFVATLFGLACGLSHRASDRYRAP